MEKAASAAFFFFRGCVLPPSTPLVADFRLASPVAILLAPIG